MKCNLANTGVRGGRPQLALTLIELVGVLAILAVLAGLLVPTTLRHLDRVAAEQEMARLQALGDALQQSILRTRYIPSYTNWATVISAQAGMDIGLVTNNIRNNARVFLVDAGGWLSTNLPYSQGYQGAPTVPANARVMLVSSLGKALPNAITNGMPSSPNFAALWNAPPGTVPWAGWTGDPDDVKIQRVNLSPLFVKLALSTYNSVTNGQYAVDSSATNAAPYNAGLLAWFLKGSVLKLFGGSPSSTFDSTQILNDDTSFVYESGDWKRAIQGKTTFGVGDVAGIVAAFLAATPNTNAVFASPLYTPANTQQVLVVQTFLNYMSNYSVWAGSNFPSGALKTYLISEQQNMMDAVHGLYYKGAGFDNYPTNSAP